MYLSPTRIQVPSDTVVLLVLIFAISPESRTVSNKYKVGNKYLISEVMSYLGQC